MIRIQRTILVDTREQRPWFVEGPVAGFEFDVQREGLATGDYTLEGAQRHVLVERKSVPDLLHCIGHGRNRFERELQRLRDETQHPWLVVEGSRHEIELCRHRSQISPASVIGSMLAWACDYRVRIWWASTAALAQRDMLRLFKRIENRVQADEITPAPAERHR